MNRPCFQVVLQQASLKENCPYRVDCRKSMVSSVGGVVTTTLTLAELEQDPVIWSSYRIEKYDIPGNIPSMIIIKQGIVCAYEPEQ